jgi:hypothetical protein
LDDQMDLNARGLSLRVGQGNLASGGGGREPSMNWVGDPCSAPLLRNAAARMDWVSLFCFSTPLTGAAGLRGALRACANRKGARRWRSQVINCPTSSHTRQRGRSRFAGTAKACRRTLSIPGSVPWFAMLVVTRARER